MALRHEQLLESQIASFTGRESNIQTLLEIAGTASHDQTTPEQFRLLKSLYDTNHDNSQSKKRNLFFCNSDGNAMFNDYLQSGYFRNTYEEAVSSALSSEEKSNFEHELAGRIFADLAENWIILKYLSEDEILLGEQSVLELSQEMFPGSRAKKNGYDKPHLLGHNLSRTYVPDALGVLQKEGDPKIVKVYEFSSAKVENEKHRKQYETFISLVESYPSLFDSDVKFVLVLPTPHPEDDYEPLQEEKSVKRVYLPFDRKELGRLVRKVNTVFAPTRDSATLFDLRVEKERQQTLRVVIGEFSSLDESLSRTGITLPAQTPHKSDSV